MKTIQMMKRKKEKAVNQRRKFMKWKKMKLLPFT